MNTELVLMMAYEILTPLFYTVLPAFVGFSLLMILVVIAVKTLLFNLDS